MWRTKSSLLTTLPCNFTSNTVFITNYYNKNKFSMIFRGHYFGLLYQSIGNITQLHQQNIISSKLVT